MKKLNLILIGIWIVSIGVASRYTRMSISTDNGIFTTQSAISEKNNKWDPRDYPCAEIKKKHNDACRDHFAEKARQNWVNADWSNAAALAARVNNTCNDISNSYEMLCKWTNNLKYWLSVENLVCYEDCMLQWGIRAQMDSKIIGSNLFLPRKFRNLKCSWVYVWVKLKCNVLSNVMLIQLSLMIKGILICLLMI